MEVPYYKQSIIGSCGPACLMMVMKYYRPKMKVGRPLEFSAWRKAALFPFGFTESFGLALFALKLGMKAMIIKEDRGFRLEAPEDDLRHHIFRFLIPTMRKRYDAMREEALRIGVKEEYRSIDFTLVGRLLDRRIPPIVMVNQSGYAPDEDFGHGILHWVVVTGYDNDTIIINDPDLGPKLKIPINDFSRAMDLSSFRTDRRLVALWEDPP